MNEFPNFDNSAEFEAIIPEGWDESQDFFSDTWAGEEDFFSDEMTEEPSAAAQEQADPTTDTPAESAEDTTDEQPAEDPAPDAPTTEPTETGEPAAPTARKLRFPARVDHTDVDIELDEADLPTVYQKSVATDRYQKKLAEISPTIERLERIAKLNGFNSVTEMLDAQEARDREQAVQKLVDEGAPRALAEDYVSRSHADIAPTVQESAPAPEPETAPVQTPVAADAPQRDFSREIEELWRIAPELRTQGLPDEVTRAALEGQPLTVAYLSHVAKQQKAANEALKKENDVYKQNAAAAARAPVRGVTSGGATDTAPEDPFIRGFNAGW